MSELRRDKISGRWVIIAPERAARPTDFPVDRRRLVGGFCPFCEGNEDKTPPEVAAVRKKSSRPNGPGWQVRVVPNRFPALSHAMPLSKCANEFSHCMTGFGDHEVIIDCPRHVMSLCELDPGEVKQLLGVYQQRLSKLRQDPRYLYAMLFKNVGGAAGATLEHAHTQLIAMPVLPTVVQDEVTNCRRYARRHGGCIFCRMLADELAARSRIIYEGGHFVALAPFASRSPFETWVIPKRHEAHFDEHPAETFGDFAQVLCIVLSRLDKALEFPAYNLLVHTSPFGEKAAPEYHWHVEIIPSVTRVAGFEWGTGCYINPVAPESAAAYLGEHKA